MCIGVSYCTVCADTERAVNTCSIPASLSLALARAVSLAAPASEVVQPSRLWANLGCATGLRQGQTLTFTPIDQLSIQPVIPGIWLLLSAS
jgi:hypothetical protein